MTRNHHSSIYTVVMINYKFKTHIDKSTVLSLETIFCDIIKIFAYDLK